MISPARGEISIDLVTVGDIGNAGELSRDRVVGSVDYVYRIGRFEITNSQYVTFLNSVAATDTYGLYEGVDFNFAAAAAIRRTGTEGSYQYSLTDEQWRNRPVANTNLWQAMRFANWLHNGQPTGEQNATTTEDGSYTLGGYTGSDDLLRQRRNPHATWVIPTENEWYKAAYYDAKTESYFDYPTGSDQVPSNRLVEPDPGNHVNAEASGMTIGAPYFVTEVGEFENSASPYGTFDQGGNLWEWTETIVESSPGVFERIARGGSYGNDDCDITCLLASVYLDEWPGDHEFNDGTPGFRVAYVPEPSSVHMLLLAAVTVAWGLRSSPLVRAGY